MLDLFIRYNRATGFKKTMSHDAFIESGLTANEFEFVYDHYDSLKEEYILFMSLLKIADRSFDLSKISDKSSYYKKLIESIR